MTDIENALETINKAERPISEVVRERILTKMGRVKELREEVNVDETSIKDKLGFLCNQNISAFINEKERELLIDEVAEKFQDVLQSLVIDTDNDHNTNGTARRVAKMFINETFGGRYSEMPPVTDFPNVHQYDSLYTVGPISIRSTCAHHFQAIKGKCWVGILPGEKVIGLSKFNRIVDWIASRPQIQEEMTEQIADEIEKITKASGIAVVMKAEHQCMTMRGVKEHNSDMTTSVMRGDFKENPPLKAELLSLIDMSK